MFGGFLLLRMYAVNRLNDFQGAYFRAGHAHAGVLLILALVFLDLLNRTKLGSGAQWTACLLLLFGILAQSGGMFLHMGIGAPGKWSAGNTVTTGGAVLL